MFVHGCFWHGHDCRKGRLPTTNVSYWLPKIENNRERDPRKTRALRDLGWRVFTLWECQLTPSELSKRIDKLAARIRKSV